MKALWESSCGLPAVSIAETGTAVVPAAALDSAKPREVLAAATDVLARGRLDGFYRRA